MTLFKEGGMGEKLDMPEGEHRWDCPNVRLGLQPSVGSALSQYFSFKKHLRVEFLCSWGILASWESVWVANVSEVGTLMLFVIGKLFNWDIPA